MFKVIELTIDDLEDFGGLEAVSIVERPAHESNFLAFDKVETPQIYEQLDEEQLNQLALAMSELGEPIGTLESEGYVLWKIEDAIPEVEEFEKFASQNGDPDAKLEPDYLPRVRYKYTHPTPAGRVFCEALIRAGRVYSDEDIELLSSLNPVGPAGYSCLMWRGSYNCRGKWSKLTYLPREVSGTIINDANSKKGLVSVEESPLFDTRNVATATAEAEGRGKGERLGPRVGGWFNEEFGVIEIIDEMPVLETKEQAELLAEKIGCKGSHEHQLDGGVVGFMPCEEHGEGYDFETYNDYPQEASDNACRVLRWIDEHGRDEVSGMERTGLARANSLCKREKISEETIGRMASFARHRKNAEINPEFKGTPWKDKGYVAWLAWGGDAGIDWAQRKLDQLAKEMGKQEMLDPNPCQAGYVAYGTKMKNGKEVPNCVPVETSEDFSDESCICNDEVCVPKNLTNSQFSTNEEKMEITGAALIPNKMIIRRTAPTFSKPEGEYYYVFFSEETIKKLAERFMEQKLLDATNIEHTDKKADSYITEAWIVEDPIHDKSAAMGLSYPKGTWVITMKVNNAKVWKQIKQGKLNGYSVEGWFNENLLFQ